MTVKITDEEAETIAYILGEVAGTVPWEEASELAHQLETKSEGVPNVDAEEASQRIDNEFRYYRSSSLRRLKDVYDDNGGPLWVTEEPRHHFSKGIDELFSATHMAHQGNMAMMDQRVRDALNHVFMATWLAHSNE